MLCNQQVKQLCCHFFCLLVDKREQRPHSQSGSTNHGVKTITSPWILYSGCRRLRSKNLLALLSQRDTVFLDSTSRTSVRSACPLPSPGWRQNHYIPMDFVFRMKTAPLESSPEFVNSLTLINKFCPLRIPFHFPKRR